MSLFVNDQAHVKIYRSDSKIIAPNQDVFRRDALSDIVEAQQQSNDALRDSLQSLEASYTKESRIQSRKIMNIRNHIKKISLERVEDQNTFEKSYTQQQEISSTIEKQLILQKNIEKHLLEQINFQKDVIARLEKQEALTEKMIRKIDHFRSILYERTNFLSEKIEKGFYLTSAYLHKITIGRKETRHQEEEQKKL